MTEPFAFLKRPDNKWVYGQGPAHWQAEPAQGTLSFYLPDFFLTAAKPWLIFESSRVGPNPPPAQPFASPIPAPVFLPTQQPSFYGRVHGLLRLIEKQELRKAVPVEMAKVELAQPLDWRNWLPRLHEAEGLLPYGFTMESEALIGLTPEVLFWRRGLRVETMALAGTAQAGDPSLLENPKERHEHQLVIEDITTNLKGLGRIEIGATQEKILPRLRHLWTPIGLELKSLVPMSELIHRLHPTAALGGLPRDRAWSWLKRQPEAQIRLRHGAPFGYSSPEEDLALVAIRNIQLSQNALWLGTGCGIVAGSDPEKEWRELELKRSAVLKGLGFP